MQVSVCDAYLTLIPATGVKMTL